MAPAMSTTCRWCALLSGGLDSKLSHGTMYVLVGRLMEVCGKTDDNEPKQLLSLPECRMRH